MALYTETLADWIENGGTLPAVFSILPTIANDTFSNIFTDHFSEWEIGFETEELFKKKLDTRAKIVVPLYDVKIRQITEKMEDGIFENKNVVSRSIKNYQNSLRVSDVSNATGNSVQVEELSTTGSTPRETQTDVILKYQNEVESLVGRLLDEFNCLFMGLC